MSFRLIGVSLALAAIAAPPAQALSSSGLVRFNLTASVPTRCGLDTVVAEATSTGSQLVVTSYCNAPRYSIDINTGSGKSITGAHSVNFATGRISPTARSVMIQPQRPGIHQIVVDLDSDISELRGMSIGLVTG